MAPPPPTFGQIPFALCLLLLAINLAFGLYKLQPAESNEGKPNLLVPQNQAKKDYIYLYQFNRTSFAPTQAALNQFIEGLLILLKTVKFHRLANQLFLGSQSTGAAPFIQHNGEYHDGVDNILAFLRKNHKEAMDKLGQFKNDQNVQKFALDLSFKILMKDRSRRLTAEKTETNHSLIKSNKGRKRKLTKEEKKANSNSEMAGLDFMLYDQGIREQMLPAVPGQLGKEKLKIGSKFTLNLLSRPFLTAYFEAANDGGRRSARQKYDQFKGNVVGLDKKNWPEFEKGMEEYISGVLRVVLISNKGASSEEKLKPLLEQNTYEDGRTYADIEEAELYNIFLNKLDALEIIHTLEAKKFLGGDNPSIGDMALFSILEQFFQTPLNIPEFKQLFQPNRLNEDDKEKLNEEMRKAKYSNHSEEKVKKVDKVLRGFFEKMKERLGLEGEKWEKVMEKPWPLNFEDIWRQEYPDKFEGPYNVNINTDKLDNLRAFLDKNGQSSKGEAESSENTENDLVTEIVKQVDEKAKELVASETLIKNLIKLLKGEKLNEQKLLEMMLAETKAYLCNLGQGKDGRGCQKELANNIPRDIQQQTRKVVYGAIVAYNDGLVRDKVAEETNRVAALATKDTANLAKYSSTAEIGNEY